MELLHHPLEDDTIGQNPNSTKASMNSQTSRIAALRNQILQAKHNYYYHSDAASLLSDAAYDSLEDELRLLSPDDPVLALVGAPVPAGSMLAKATHAMPMGSQDKVNSVEEFLAWARKRNVGALHASLKGDGGSVAAYYKDGFLTQAIGRGDGFVGEDITANAYHFKGLPNYVATTSGGFTGSVRFEGILTVADWAIVDPAKSKNPRNAGNGILRRKDGSESELITAFAFDIDEYVDGELVAWSTEVQKIARLVDLGFNVIDSELVATPEAAIEYFQRVNAARDKLPFWIDGIVLKVNDVAVQKALGVTANCPQGQTSWKFDSAGAETVLESVIISGGHTGKIVPTAQFRPVEIGGTTVTSALLSNFDEIDRLGLAIGDGIWVVKKNDIIPGIVRVTERPATRLEIQRPTCCPFCGAAVGYKKLAKGEEGVILYCLNPDCEKKSTGKIGRWISSLDILGVGDALLESLVERFDLEDVSGLYTLHERAADLAQLVTNVDKDLRLGEKRATSLLAAIDLKRNLTLSQFLGSLGLDSLGKRRVDLMMKAAGGELDTLDAWRAGKLNDAAFAARAGVPGIGAQIQAGIEKMGPVIDKLLAAGVTIAAPVVNTQVDADKPTLKTLCISGSLPSGNKKAFYKAPLLAAGYELVDDVTKGVSLLVLADPNSTSGKAQKAAKLGIKVISEDAMVALFAGPV